MSHANGDHQKQKIDREHHSVNGNEGSRPGVSGYGYRVVQPRQRHYARSPGGLISDSADVLWLAGSAVALAGWLAGSCPVSYNQNLWIAHLSGGAAYLPR
jgi:hypothetical protein